MIERGAEGPDRGLHLHAKQEESITDIGEAQATLHVHALLLVRTTNIALSPNQPAKEALLSQATFLIRKVKLLIKNLASLLRRRPSHLGLRKSKKKNIRAGE